MDNCVCWWPSLAGVGGEEEEGDRAAKEMEEVSGSFSV